MDAAHPRIESYTSMTPHRSPTCTPGGIRLIGAASGLPWPGVIAGCAVRPCRSLASTRVSPWPTPGGGRSCPGYPPEGSFNVPHGIATASSCPCHEFNVPGDLLSRRGRTASGRAGGDLRRRRRHTVRRAVKKPHAGYRYAPELTELTSQIGHSRRWRPAFDQRHAPDGQQPRK